MLHQTLLWVAFRQRLSRLFSFKIITMKIISPLIMTFVCLQLYACNDDKTIKPANNPNNISNTDSMKIKITVGKKIIAGILYDNPASGDFASLLPLELNLQDYNRTEKIS